MGFFTCEQFPILVSLGMSPIGGREIYERFDKGFFFSNILWPQESGLQFFCGEFKSTDIRIQISFFTRLLSF